MATTSDDEMQIEYLDIDNNESANYLKCSTAKENIEPFTSPQKTIAKKIFKYHKIVKNSDSENTDCSQSPAKSKVPSGEILVQNNNLLKSALKELHYLRREQKCMRIEIEKLKTSLNNNNTSSKSKFSLNIPRSTAESFLELEEEVKTQDGENALKLILNGLGDVSMDKYVRACLKSIVLDQAACSFSWFGHHGNTAVHTFTVMNIIKECAMEKCPNARVGDVIGVIKKWFQYAKDRQRKLDKKSTVLNFIPT